MGESLVREGRAANGHAERMKSVETRNKDVNLDPFSMPQTPFPSQWPPKEHSEHSDKPGITGIEESELSQCRTVGTRWIPQWFQNPATTRRNSFITRPPLDHYSLTTGARLLHTHGDAKLTRSGKRVHASFQPSTAAAQGAPRCARLRGPRSKGHVPRTSRPDAAGFRTSTSGYRVVARQTLAPRTAGRG
jgi:hypothetical protein